MQVITVNSSIAANSTSANLIAGRLNEFLEAPSAVTLYATAAAVGLFATFQVGNEVFSDEQEVLGTNPPIVPDDLFVVGVGGPGERITLRVRNSTGGAIVFQARIEIS